jgi:DNA-binding HxlR family transcriptional regulator
VFCGVAAAAELLGDAWTLLLVRDLANGPRRFKELEASTRISPRVLTDRLRALTAKGMLTRTMYAEIPPRVEYELTEKGRDVLPIIDSLRDYGMRWLHPSGPLGEPAASGD